MADYTNPNAYPVFPETSAIRPDIVQAVSGRLLEKLGHEVDANKLTLGEITTVLSHLNYIAWCVDPILFLVARADKAEPEATKETA